MREWETLVLFAVNLSKLDVMVNMSNVMGNTVYVIVYISHILMPSNAIALFVILNHMRF